MKTIIKQGKNTYVITCERCDCEFSYQDEDIIVTKGYYTEKEVTLSKEVACPCCNNMIYLRGTK